MIALVAAIVCIMRFAHSKTTDGIVEHIHVVKFQAFSNPGDSRIFEAVFNNGTVVAAYGQKLLRGTLANLQYVTVKDKGSRPSRLHITKNGIFDNVFLPDGTFFQFIWSKDFRSLICKAFLPTTPRNHTIPLTYFASIDIENFQDIFKRHLYNVHHQEESNAPQPEVHDSGKVRKCALRIPVRATRCMDLTDDGQIEADLSLNDGDRTFTTYAVPWTHDDPNCYRTYQESPNFYIPIPALQTNTTFNDFSESTAKIVTHVCELMNELNLETGLLLCRTIADGVQTISLNSSGIYDIVLHGCQIGFHASRLMCKSLGLSEHESVKGSGEDAALSVANLLRSSLNDVTNDIIPNKISIKVKLFCPSGPPRSELKKNIYYDSIYDDKNFISLNCWGLPEIVSINLVHRLRGPAGTFGLTQVSHSLIICTRCAAGDTIEVKIREDEFCCKDTCGESRKCEIVKPTSAPMTQRFRDRHTKSCLQFMEVSPPEYTNDFPRTNKNCLKDCYGYFSVSFTFSYSGEVSLRQTISCDANSMSCTVNQKA